MRTDLQIHIEKLVTRYRGVRAAARALGVDPAFLSRLRLGRKKNPSDATLAKLGLRRESRLTAVKPRA